AGVVDLEHPDTRAVVDGGELIEPLARPRDALEELHVHLQSMTGLRLLVALPALLMGLVLLVVWQPAHTVLDEDPVHRGAGDLHLVEALEVIGDPARSEVIALP